MCIRDRHLTKRADCSSAVAGDAINYTIAVTNNGNVTLDDINVVDAKLGINENVGSLSPGASRSLTGNYTVAEVDLPGPLVNTATANAVSYTHLDVYKRQIQG